MSRGRVKEVITETFEPILEGNFRFYPITKEVKSGEKKGIARQKEEGAESP